nr:unnamed protein product [Spirometra erinaceieuropaei]
MMTTKSAPVFWRDTPVPDGSCGGWGGRELVDYFEVSRLDIGGSSLLTMAGSPVGSLIVFVISTSGLASGLGHIPSGATVATEGASGYSSLAAGGRSSKEEQTIVIWAAETMGNQRSFDGMACAEVDVEVTKDNQLIRLQDRRQEGVQVIVEFVFRFLRAGHRGSVEIDDGGDVASPERQSETRHAFLDALRRTGQSSYNVSDGNGDAYIPSLCPGATALEEGVPGSHVLLLVLFEKPSLIECSGAHLVARQFPNDLRRRPFLLGTNTPGSQTVSDLPACEIAR